MNIKIKKIVTITGISLGVLIGGGLLTFKIMENAFNYEAREAANENGTMNEYNDSKESKEQTRKIVSGFKKGSGISTSSGQSEVITVMHHMTHQKVKSDKKWGAIPMSPENIKEVKSAIEGNDLS